MTKPVLWFDEIGLKDIPSVGGKNASLGEMIANLSNAGVRVPGGFATAASAYCEFLQHNQLQDKIFAELTNLNIDNIKELADKAAKIRAWIMAGEFSEDFASALKAAYEKLATDANMSFAVRSSATAEDLPNASFAGQQETYLNVVGFDNVLLAIKKVFASLFNDRAIAYREHQGFKHEQVEISAGIQRMVRSDLAASGVMFSLDTESGFRDAVFINAAYGLGECVVQGSVNPDEFYVYKPALKANKSAILRRHLGSKHMKMIYAEGDALVTTEDVREDLRQQFCLTQAEIECLARHALTIEEHYGRPMDIEWAKDGLDGELYILQARPETVQAQQTEQTLERYQLHERSKVLVEGRSVGQRIGQGTAKVLKDIRDINRVEAGDVIVTDMTDPDWEPVMKKASAIVTNRGGRTCHAAIIARELGIPAIVGCGNATERVTDLQAVTVSCAEGDTGFIYDGLLEFELKRINLEKMPDIPIKIMMNVANPERAFAFQNLPNAGIGLARLEFIINQMIGIHPKALLNFSELPKDLQQQVSNKIAAYSDPVEYYVERLKEGIASIAAAFYPKPVIVRLSDFKSNEYANLLGGQLFEPEEENPMLGFRGASRYISTQFRDCFVLECQALKRVRDGMGLDNVEIMVPFVRTLNEAKAVSELLASAGLARGDNGLRHIMMCELPSNALLAEEFLQYFDGFSIGSNDLTQLTLGLDRDSGIVAELFDERDPAVKALLAKAISACRKAGKYIGICGQGPSDHPDLAEWLLEQGIDSVSLNPDTVLDTWLYLAKQQQS